MIGDVRNLLDRVARRAGIETGGIRTKAFRHTYCAARLQTLDQGAPVSTYTVARELGHESEAMVWKVYAHLGIVRNRSESWSTGSSNTLSGSAIGSSGWDWQGLLTLGRTL